MCRITNNIKNEEKISSGRIIMIVLQLILLVVTVPTIASAQKSSDKKEKKKEVHPDSYYFKQFQDVFHRIEKDYMQEPDRQEMTDEAINGMLRSLDPYSSYHTDEDLEYFMSTTEGEFGGIGVEITYENGAVKIITPIDDLPAYKAGIGAGDLIVGVNGQLVSNMGFDKAVKEMRGEPGSKLNLLIIKEEDHTSKEVELTREIVKIKPIKYEIEEDELGNIGYIRIVAFNNKTSADLKSAVDDITKKLKKKNKSLNGIILDVRNNPGGLLDQAIAVSEYFIDHGTIVSVKGREKENDNVTSAGRFVTKAPNVPMVVLINGGSASASEIVAGALQDHNRAVIVGTTSFGKGLVQTFTQINKRAGVKLTTSKYFTPSGRSINATGIEPDIYIENAKVEYAEKEKKDSSFSSASVKSYLKKYNTEDKVEETLDNKDKKKPKDDKEKEHVLSEKYKSDYQYARAFDLIRGLIVSGSQGKM